MSAAHTIGCATKRGKKKAEPVTTWSNGYLIDGNFRVGTPWSTREEADAQVMFETRLAVIRITRTGKKITVDVEEV